MQKEIDKANDIAIKQMMDSRPCLVGLGKAIDCIPGMRKNLFLHAGPPITWDRVSEPLKGAIIGAILFEGLASTKEEAIACMEKGIVTLGSCNDHRSVGPMAGLITPSMSVYIIEDKSNSKCYYSNMSDNAANSRGQSLRFGIFNKEAIQHLHWMEDVQAPVFQKVIKALGEIDLRALIAESLHMGDECHTRVKATSLLYMKAMAHLVPKFANNTSDADNILETLATDTFCGLNVAMATAKAMTAAAHGIEKSTLVTVFSRNGTDFGIKVSGLDDQWFTGPAEIPSGLWFPGYTAEDANPDIGDSAIMEAAGLGGLAMAASPASVTFIGGDAQEALNITMDMYEITHSEHKHFTIPALNFRGTPVGIDIRKVIERNLRPHINTGIANRKMNCVMVGCGAAHPPMEAFETALEAFVSKYTENNKTY